MTTSARGPRAACLIGWPAAHSRWPLIHHYWLRTLGIEGGYNIEAVPPEGFAEFILHLSTHGFIGANVTRPHKERALALSAPDARARAVGAANTLWYDGAKLCSTNTDVEGFINNLDASAPGWDRARAMRWCSAPAGRRARCCSGCWSVASSACISPIAPSRAHRRWADQFGAAVLSRCVGRGRRVCCRTRVCWSTRPRSACTASRRWKSISAGCPGCGGGRPRLCAAEDAVVRGRQARGLRCADGLGMLLHQAVRGFELWFGRRPEVTAELRALVEADLTKV